MDRVPKGSVAREDIVVVVVDVDIVVEVEVEIDGAIAVDCCSVFVFVACAAQESAESLSQNLSKFKLRGQFKSTERVSKSTSTRTLKRQKDAPRR